MALFVLRKLILQTCMRSASDIKPHWMAAHACLKNEFIEGEKCHNIMTQHNFFHNHKNICCGYSLRVVCCLDKGNSYEYPQNSFKENCRQMSQLMRLWCLSHRRRRGARWLSGRVSDSGARGRGFETYRRRVVSFSKTLYSPKVPVNYPGSGGSVPT